MWGHVHLDLNAGGAICVLTHCAMCSFANSGMPWHALQGGPLSVCDLVRHAPTRCGAHCRLDGVVVMLLYHAHTKHMCVVWRPQYVPVQWWLAQHPHPQSGSTCIDAPNPIHTDHATAHTHTHSLTPPTTHQPASQIDVGIGIYIKS